MQRELFAFLAGPAVLATIWFGPTWLFQLLTALVVVGASAELATMARGAGLPVGRAVPMAVAVVLGGAWIGGPAGFLVAIAAVATVLPLLQLADPRSPTAALEGLGVAVLTAVTLGVGGACLGWLREWGGDDRGPALVILFLVAIWTGDSGAYYAGKTLGRHKMSPRFSPNKTWQGLAGGVVATFVGASVVRSLALPELPWAHLVAVAAILAATAPLGDLVESMLKRSTGVKDSSGLVPGHGGLLDRTDSVLYSAPPVLGYLVLTGVVTP